MNRLAPILFPAILLSALSPVTAHSEQITHSAVHTDRYTLHSVAPRADQAAPMNAIINVSMGKDVLTVGDAVREILKGSGYRWADNHEKDKLLDTLPLPSIVRELGPITVSDALRTVAGESWLLRSDDLNRVVWFEVNPKKNSAF